MSGAGVSGAGAVSVLAMIVPRPEFVAQVETELRAMAQASRQEPGNLRYDVLRENSGDSDAARLHIVERYRDMAALEAHRASPHYLAYRAKAGDWLAQAPQVMVLHDVDVAQ